MKLEGQTALVTGSGRNIGRATVLAMAREGANVVVNARTNQAEADAVAQEARDLGVKAISVIADVSDKAQVDDMVAKALEAFGRIDILISNAAIRPHKPFLEVTYEDWRHVLGVVLEGAFFCSQAALPSMVAQNSGRLIFLSGDGAFTGGAMRAHVSAPKMGLTGLARGLASEFAPHNITVNVVSPGAIDTTRDLSWYPGRNPSQAADSIPLKRLGQPNEIAATCLFLASDEGGFITGQTIHVNGGAHYF